MEDQLLQSSQQLEELNRELIIITRKLVTWMIPFHPPAKNWKCMEANNPKGYSLLVKYLNKEAIYQELKKEVETLRQQVLSQQKEE